ncbi:hypothetical protein GDO86_014976 [Hymenochirus boettgeri]|uniref:THD domain-containing protein n=1 Tax=Hymenochirus boettgeri TaxID=247094 RepID=A0A8T2JUT5_9PIPI|nr:hypothetical protein GDO86_014976 [Hymenochirus boettgeri]
MFSEVQKCERSAQFRMEVELEQVNNSNNQELRTLLWNVKKNLRGMMYQNGSLTAETEGLYYIYCHLHFIIESCCEDAEDLQTILNVNGNAMHNVLSTVTQPTDSNSKIYRDQYLSLQLFLNVNDSISIQTSHVSWLNVKFIPDANLFGAFKL